MLIKGVPGVTRTRATSHTSRELCHWATEEIIIINYNYKIKTINLISICPVCRSAHPLISQPIHIWSEGTFFNKHWHYWENIAIKINYYQIIIFKAYIYNKFVCFSENVEHQNGFYLRTELKSKIKLFITSFLKQGSI